MKLGGRDESMSVSLFNVVKREYRCPLGCPLSVLYSE